MLDPQYFWWMLSKFFNGSISFFLLLLFFQFIIVLKTGAASCDTNVQASSYLTGISETHTLLKLAG